MDQNYLYTIIKKKTISSWGKKTGESSKDNFSLGRISKVGEKVFRINQMSSAPRMLNKR